MSEAKQGDRITSAEIFEMFGEEMPIEAAQLLFEGDSRMTIGDARAALRAIAALTAHHERIVAERDELLDVLRRAT